MSSILRRSGLPWAAARARILVPLLVLILGGCQKPPGPDAAKIPAPTVPAAEGHRENYIEEANVVEVSLEAQRRAGIGVAPITAGQVEDRVILTGTVQPMDSRIAVIHALARGRVETIGAKVGDRVQAGDAIVQFDNIEAGGLAAQYNAAMAELQRLKVQAANARRQSDRRRELADKGVVAIRDAENAETEAAALGEAVKAQQATLDGVEAQLKRFGVEPGGAPNPVTTIRAPFSGVVTAVSAAPGSVIDSATPLLTIADLSQVYVEAQVFEKDLGRVHVGQSTQVRFTAYPNEVFRGRIASIRDILDPQTRTAGVRVELPNPAGRLRLEMFAEIELPTVATHTALRVPSEAVQTVNRRTVVFTQRDALHFAAQEVMTADDGLMTEIVSGLKEGEMVVTKGAYQLKSIFVSRQLQGEHEH